MSYFFKALAELSDLFVQKQLNTEEGVVILDYHFVTNLLNDQQLNLSDQYQKLIQFNLDVAYLLNGYISVSEYETKYANCFNPTVLGQLKSDYFLSLLKVKKEFYEKYYSQLLTVYEELKSDG